MKPFFRLDDKNKQGDVVEYSTDFNFFLKHQVMLIHNCPKYQFCSRLESKTFKVLSEAPFGLNPFTKTFHERKELIKITSTMDDWKKDMVRKQNKTIKTQNDIEDKQINEIYKEIHKEILQGKHGSGKLVD